MKYLIFGDVHSNLEAFISVLNFSLNLNIDKYICTGDVIGYGANPSECIEILKSLPLEIYAIGNHEKSLLSNNLNNMSERASKGIEYSNKMLSEEQKKWINKTVCLKNKFNSKCAVSHSSYFCPMNFSYLEKNEIEIEMCFKSMKKDDVEILFVGHSHLPGLFFIKNNNYFLHSNIDLIDLESVKPCIINVGSVGQPRDGDCRASFSVYDSSENKVSMYRINYDNNKTCNKIIEVGLPEFLGKRLLIGI